MPAYKAGFLEKAIESILSQSLPDWELIVVDDASPEDLKSIVLKFNDSRIKYFRNTSNIGGEDLVRQWNHSISFANGEWIVLAADDDMYLPDFCCECLKLAELYPDVNIIRSRVLQIDEDGNPFWEDNTFPEYVNKYEYLYDWVTAKAFTCIGNFMFRRSSLEKIGGFLNFPCAFGSDIATPIALSENGVANTSEMLFCFRQSTNHLSADTSRFKEKIAGITKLYKWLISIDYETPNNEKDSYFYSIKNYRYLQAKCIYDYFNLVIKFVPLKSLPEFLSCCKLASGLDKSKMVLRWIKRKWQGA